ELLARSRAEIPADAARFGFVAAKQQEAEKLLENAISLLESRPQAEAWNHPRGIFYQRAGMDTAGKVVAVFPGQGSQYLNMGREIALNFPPLREAYAQMDAHFITEGSPPLSQVVFPIPAFDEERRQAQSATLRATDYAQAGIGTFSLGLYKILVQAGFQADFTAGHSFGELSALWAGDVLDDAGFLTLVKARGKAMSPPEGQELSDTGTMLAVKGDLAKIEEAVAAWDEVLIANQNSPSQVVLAGPTPAIENARRVLGDQGFKVTPLPVSAAFHTPLVAHASEPFAAAVAAVPFHEARIPVYSNTTGDPYPSEEREAQELLGQHILHPVIFKSQIEHIYAAGGRVFVEIGPRRIVTNLVDAILGDRPHLALPLNASRQKSSDRQLRTAVVQLKVAGVPLGDIDPYQVAS
ncbi:MAG: acyltransferase domain-containing protein, partial [Anaerolineae bacterium]|nr:acyltransferase domain-containing protein [Anaerolineae bacterium]